MKTFLKIISWVSLIFGGLSILLDSPSNALPGAVVFVGSLIALAMLTNNKGA